MKITKGDKTFEIHRDTINVTPMSEPDPNWRKECQCGVVHKWHSEDPDWEQAPGLAKVMLPTLNWIVDFPGTDELPAEGHYECKNCGAVIRPISRTPFGEYNIPGRITCTINGKEVSKEEFEKALEEI